MIDFCHFRQRVGELNAPVCIGHWRIQLSDARAERAKIYHAGFSPNLVEKPRLNKPLGKLLSSVIKMRAMQAR